MTGQEWITAYAAKLGLAPPSEATVEQLLALAAAAAHGSERTAAPIACYLVGRSGIDPVRAAEVAATVDGGY